MLHLGDRGDGATAGKETARQRYAHINAGHVDVPDFIRFGVKPQCYELKFLHPLLGSTDKGGAASTADGRWTADASPWATLRKPGLRGTRPPRRRERSVYARRVEGDDLVPLRWFASVRVCMRESRRRLGAGHRVTRATGRTASRTTERQRDTDGSRASFPSVVPCIHIKYVSPSNTPAMSATTIPAAARTAATLAASTANATSADAVAA
jgi:hypothetical protein